VWLPLPASTDKFHAALKSIGGENGGFKIREYNCRVPAMGRSMLMEAPLATANYLAARLNKLYDFEILLLCAVCDSEYYFDRVGQFIDFTFQTFSYHLQAGITDEEKLGAYHISHPKHYLAGVDQRQLITRREFGAKVAALEKGVFTPHGYLTSSIGWNLPPQERVIPPSLNLTGYLGEHIYGDWDEYDLSA
jgi:hypothetical protein